MVDDLPTVFEADEHTLAKHRILEAYLKAWMPIITQQSAKVGATRAVRYVDGFAGAGEYTNGEPGSPIVALQVALRHVKPFPVPVRVLAVEARKDRYEHLCGVLEGLRSEIEASPSVVWIDPQHNECEVVLEPLLSRAESGSEKLGPALFFLDQFGYSAVSLEAIARIVAHPVCEVFAFMNWRDLNRFIEDEHKWPGITRAFGGEQWKEVLELPRSQMQARLRELYEEALRSAGVAYLCRFDMRDRNDKLLYWLFFCSQNPRGLEEMKRAMWSVDTSGQFLFSDRHANHPLLLPAFDDAWLSNVLLQDLAGRSCSIREVWEHVLVNTPCYTYARALGLLERQGLITLEGVPPGRRTGFAKYLNTPGFRVVFPPLVVGQGENG